MNNKGHRTAEEIERRRDEAIRRALNTPPKPRAGKKKDKPAPTDAPSSSIGTKRGRHGPAA